MKTKWLILILPLIFLQGCTFCLYQHSVQIEPQYEGLENTIGETYAAYYEGYHSNSRTGTFIPFTAIPAVDILETIFSVDGVVDTAGNIAGTVLDNTATSEVLKSQFVPYKVKEEKRWFVFSTGKKK